MTVQLRGELETGRVWLFGEELFAENSLSIQKHSPTGFAWGYSGSGPAQLALAICLELYGEEQARRVYQDFKFKYISTLPQSDFERDLDVDI